MRKPLAIILTLGFLVGACGNANPPDSCADVGGVCIRAGATCGDTLPYQCPSDGVCCSPTSRVGVSDTAASKGVEPVAR